MKIQKYIGEVFSLVNQAETEEEKIKILRQNKTPGMMELFKFAYEPTYVSLIKEVPKYKPDDSPYGYSYSDLNKEYHRIYYFFDPCLLIKQFQIFHWNLFKKHFLILQ
jgi:hypothetical protein